jgi:GNAT superfamily N-acetyltransferase
MEEQVAIRFVGGSDYGALLELQKKNSLAALTEEERSDGFLSGQLSREQLASMHESAGIVVAAAGDAVIAFLCLSTLAANRDMPIVQSMRTAMCATTFDGKALDGYQCVVAGPVCVDRRYRGQGVFEQLYEFAVAHVSSRFDVAVAFISMDNARSLKAHAKVGMIPLAVFEHAGSRYHLVARRLMRPMDDDPPGSGRLT